MEKALEMGKISATGSFQLFIGKTTSTIIMAIGTIILARLMLPEEYGLYTVALIPPLMINLFQDWGISPAMTKYIAHYKATNKDENIHNIIAAGLIFKVTTGLALSSFNVSCKLHCNSNLEQTRNDNPHINSLHHNSFRITTHSLSIKLHRFRKNGTQQPHND